MVDIASSLTNLQEKIQLLLKRAALMEKENMQLKASLNKEQNHVKELMDEVQQGKSKIAAAMVNTASMQPSDKEALIKKVDHYIKEIDTAIKNLNP
jgi:predicted nuclease with TOPRIM domain